MSEEGTPPGPEPPKLKLVDHRARSSAPISQELYEQIWTVYRDLKDRTIGALSRETGLNYKTAAKAVNIGWPNRGWPSLRERAILWDKQVREQADKPLSPKQVVDLERFMAIREGELNSAGSLRSMGAILFKRVLAAVDQAVMTRTYRRHRIIQVPHGKRTVERHVQEDVELPPYLPHLASVARDVAALVTAANDIEKVWAKILPPENIDAGGDGWDGLSEEQHRYIIENDGKLPPGVNAERFRRR